PVDHGPITTALERLDAGAGPWDLASEKLRMTAALLRLRRRRPEAFVGNEAGYRVLRTSTGHAVAFARTVAEQAQVVTVVTRRLQQLRSVGGWGEHSLVLPEGRWLDVVGGAEHGDGEVPLAELLRSGPVAVLEQVQQG
ncbi:MAG TPA: malto-oligosyltrehalose synthase, partial [Ruania sp.]|nr:malto-oligosyltrehalose synthase [Ruania sp.]